MSFNTGSRSSSTLCGSLTHSLTHSINSWLTVVILLGYRRRYHPQVCFIGSLSPTSTAIKVTREFASISAMASLGAIRTLSHQGVSMRRVGICVAVPLHSVGALGFSARRLVVPRSIGVHHPRPCSSHVGQSTLQGMLRSRPSPWMARLLTPTRSSTPSSSRHQHSWSFPHPPRRRYGFVFLSAGAIGFLAYRHLTSDRSAYPPTGSIIPLNPTTNTAHAAYPTHSAAEAHWTLVSIFHRYILEPILTIVRFLHLTLLFGPVILTAPMLLIGRPGSGGRRGKRAASGMKVEDEERWGAVWWYGFLVKQMERSGPTFIKVGGVCAFEGGPSVLHANEWVCFLFFFFFSHQQLGQWAASRADLFPAVLCDLMGKLHSNGDPHSFRHTKKALEKVFNRKFEDIFDEFDQKPIGCGAIAQVRMKG